MNISLTCCVSLVGFDWGPNPSLRCMNVGLNIHQMLSQKLYPLLSTTQRHKQAPTRTRGAQPGAELQPWLYLLFARVISACSAVMFEGGAMSCGYMDEVGGSAQVNPLHLPHPPAVLLLPAGSSTAFQPSEDHICCCSLAPSVAAAADANLVRKPAGTFLMHGSSYMF